jgi:hypothetical protein
VAAGYRIIDEPQPGPMASMAVSPIWPLFAIMFGGVWLSWPWFVLNGYAVGSPTRVKELTTVIVGLVGNVAFVIVFGTLASAEVIPRASAPYFLLVLTVWKLAVSYRVYILQARTFGVYEYFGGLMKNGLLAVIAGYFVGGVVVIPALASVHPVLLLILR